MKHTYTKYDIKKLQDERSELQAENKRLKEYVQHKKDCEWETTEKRSWKYKLAHCKCTCGLDQALQEKP